MSIKQCTIVDQVTLDIIEKERIRRGLRSAASTARALIVERFIQIHHTVGTPTQGTESDTTTKAAG